MSSEFYIALLWVSIGLFSGFIAKKKNQKVRDWLVLGVILGPIAVLILLITPKKRDISSIKHHVDPYESKLKYLKLKEEFEKHKRENEIKSKEKNGSE